MVNFSAYESISHVVDKIIWKNKTYEQQHILQGNGVHGGSGVVGVHVVGLALKQLDINQEVSSHSSSSSLFQEKISSLKHVSLK